MDMTANVAPVDIHRVPDIEILGTDHIEFWVGNARQAAYYYQRAFGFSLVAYAGPETGLRDRASYVLQQGKIRFVLTTGLAPDHPVVRHQALHGDGVRDVALWVTDARQSFAAAVGRGAVAVRGPEVLSDGNGQVVVATIAAAGDTLHTFVERSAYSGPFLPGFQAAEGLGLSDAGLKYVDHVVTNVEDGRMVEWQQHYERVFGFRFFANFDDKDISTEFSALRSVVVANHNERIKMPINEPAEGRRRSQIQEYLDYYGGPGVQHIALATDDIVHTVRTLRANGVAFQYTPDSYYDTIADRLPGVVEDIEALKALGILVDRDDKGYMLQLFTKPVEDRPTLFFEIIQRRGSTSFGKGNFKALFESIERDQAARGNL